MKFLPLVGRMQSGATHPSTFWLTIYCAGPLLSSSTMAMWVRLGLADAKVKPSSFGIGLPCFWHVQTPFGPLKSGIPMEVDIPAPVIMTVFFEDLNCIKHKGSELGRAHT